MNETAACTSKIGRHWAIPLAALSLLIALGAVMEGKSFFLLPAGLALAAAFGIWTNRGARRTLAIDQFFGTGSKGKAGFWTSMVLTAVLVVAAATALGEFATGPQALSGQAEVAGGQNPATEGPQEQRAAMPTVGDGDLSAKTIVLTELLESIGATLDEVMVELQDPALSQARYEELMRRVDLLQAANITIGCQLMGHQGGCEGHGPRIEDDAQWNRVYAQVTADARQYLAPL